MTPPTYSPWWRPLEALARFGFTRNRPAGSPGRVGDHALDHDCTNDQTWRNHLSPRSLFEAWSPPQTSPWSAYAKPTLFAALPDKPRDLLRPARAPHLPEPPGPEARVRIPEGTGVILDLPGAMSVARGAWLARTAGMQPVPLFNNWPHPMGVVPADATLAALLYYVPWAMQDRDLRGDKAPPVFLLDRQRLGTRRPAIRDFDNRYFHNEADFPTGAILRRHGIQRLLYVRPDETGLNMSQAPAERTTFLGFATPVWTVVSDEMDDLNAYLVAARKTVGLDIATAPSTSWGLGPATEFAPKPRKTPFTTTKDPAFHGFRRSGAGGFGKLIPEPSQGGGGFG